MYVYIYKVFLKKSLNSHLEASLFMCMRFGKLCSYMNRAFLTFLVRHVNYLFSLTIELKFAFLSNKKLYSKENE